MNASSIFISLSRKVFLAVCCLATGALEAAVSEVAQSASVNAALIEYPCQDLSELPMDGFVQRYIDLEKAAFKDPANQQLREFRQPFLERLFLSFKDVEALHAGKSASLYEILIHKLAGFMLAPLDEPQLIEVIETNSLAWQDFKDFLAFYAPQTDYYKEFTLNEQRYFVDELYEKFKNHI